MVKLYEYQLGLRKGLILQLESGFGEIAPLPSFSRESLDEARAEILNWIDQKTEPTLPSVRWGIECAKRSLRPIHLPLCALGPKPGFKTVKLKLGHLFVSEAIRFVREHVGRFELRLDCNRAWTLAQALEFASHFKPTDFAYLEEPVQTFEELVAFSRQSGFPVALDESIRCDWSQIPTLKAIVVKPMLIGFIPEVPPSLDLVLSSSYESGLGLLHIANRAANRLPIGLDTLQPEDLLLNPIQSQNGFFSWKGPLPLIDWSKLCAL